MNKEFLNEIEILLNSIENNTKEHWKKYYKDVPIDCIYDDLVIDINEIKRLGEENKKLKEDYNIAVHKATEYESETYELKKQLEEINYTIIPNCDIKLLIDKFRTQQKELINYLENEYNKVQFDIEKEIDNNVKYFKIERRQIIAEILQKYKEIIGEDKECIVRDI